MIIEGRKECPLEKITKLSDLYLAWHPIYENGENPCSGGNIEQPLKFRSAMNIIANVKRDIKNGEND